MKLVSKQRSYRSLKLKDLKFKVITQLFAYSRNQKLRKRLIEVGLQNYGMNILIKGF